MICRRMQLSLRSALFAKTKLFFTEKQNYFVIITCDPLIYTKEHPDFTVSNIVYKGLIYSKTCLKRPLKKDQKIGFQDRLLLNAGQKYWKMLQREHSAILWTFIKLPFTIKTFVLSIFKWSLKTGFTVGAIAWEITWGNLTGRLKEVPGLQIVSRLVGQIDPWSQKWCVIFWNDGSKLIKLTVVDIWVVYFTYTLTQTLVCIYVYWMLIIQ